MTLKCWLRGQPGPGLKPDNPSKPGNGVQNFADKDGMERGNRPVRRPYWEDAPVVIPSEDK